MEFMDFFFYTSVCIKLIQLEVQIYILKQNYNN